MKIAFYNVDLDYIDYLKKFESAHRGFTRVPNVQYRSGNNKFFYGTVLNIQGIDYFVPISSKQHNREDDIQIKPKNDKYCKEYATLRFAYMLPIPHQCITMLNISEISNNTQKERVRKELAYCRKFKDKIEKQAEKTYHRIVDKVNDKLVHNSCDFKLLEQAYIKYCIDNGLELPKDLQTQETLFQKEEVYQQINSNQINDLANSGIPFKAKKISDNNFIIVFEKKYNDKVNQILSQNSCKNLKHQL